MDFEFVCENNSGQGKGTPVPEAIRGWNWGAFLLNWIWGVGNSTFIALLMFVPLVGMVMPFVLGAKGNQWAWQNKTWKSVEHFKATQKRWAISGLIIVVVSLSAFFFLITGIMKYSDAYRLSLDVLQHDPQVIELVGEPVSPGLLIIGNVQASGGTGRAVLSYTIAGPKGEATAHVFASKEIEGWQLKELTVYSEEQQKRIDLITQSRPDGKSLEPGSTWF
ncbi:cytochrome c oxidase assembly factor Coa1 family protein [Trichloromonas sp.]|uniref:cytochrome c oxidase assembly factor Coa1 family protein n=1 Tax=Trichloromonas sp. TaxID=3069249 RepID=UPI003D8141CF